MGRTNGTSWLAKVKRAFRSPTRDGTNTKEDRSNVEEEKREAKRWLFKRRNNVVEVMTQDNTSQKVAITHATDAVPNVFVGMNQRHAIAVAAATAVAAEAAAKAAAKIVRLASPCASVRVRHAAIVIQTAFRGFLARKAVKAFKGIVKLQALIRGQNVRRQAKTTLRCMQALFRVQQRITYQRGRLSHDGAVRKSKSHSNCGEWEDRPRPIGDVVAVMKTKKEAAIKREKALAYAFSNQIWCTKSPFVEYEDEEKLKWLGRWMATRPWDSRRDANIKTVEVDTTTPTRRRTSSSYFLSTPRRSVQQLKPGNICVRSATPAEEIWCSTPRINYCGGERPSYMATTESAKAKSRSLSTPRQRRDTSARKRLCYQEGRSPLRTSCGESETCSSHAGTRSANGGQVSPSSTSDSRYFSQPLFY